MSLPVEISIPLPTDQTYFYSLPNSYKKPAEIGKRVLVPFRNRVNIGFIVGFGEPPEGIELKSVIDVIDEKPLFDKPRLEFYRRVADYYIASLGIVLKIAHPGGVGTTLRRYLVATEKGLKKLRQGKCNESEYRILNTVNLSQNISAEKLFELVDGTNFVVLNRVISRGLLEYRYSLKELKPKYKKLIKSKYTAQEPIENLRKKMPAKAAILDFLFNHNNIDIEELKEIFPNVNSHIKWLEENNLVEVELKEVMRDPFRDIDYNSDPVPQLTADQRTALKKIDEAINENRYSTFLLHGITGSGKTEVYLRAIENALKKGKESIVLVPEISLTPLLVKRFRGRFGDNVAVIHSLLSEGERFDAWRAASEGRVKIVIGARSAVFAPFENLGVVIVDEEHENTYKQEDSPYYNARDVAIILGQMTGSTVILGSATPSVESYSNCIRQKFAYLSLPLRVGKQALPEVNVVDMRKERGPVFSKVLEREVVDNFKNGNQTILFLNRRGYSTFLIYQDSGEIFNCPNCSIPFTYHSDDNRIKCHYCGTSEDFDVVKKSGSSPLMGYGIGTQLIEHELVRILPDARIERMDRDSTGSKSKLMNLYKKLEKGEIDILIGTQMVAKGHDLPGVTLVGVVSADNMLSIPDFRSGERTFQLVTQVAGRAGRGETPGKVIVQTFNPNHPSIRFSLSHDSKAFLEKEIKLREMIDYPPFSKLVNFRFSSADESVLKEKIKQVDKLTRVAVSKLTPGSIGILGPSECPIYRIKNRYRWQMILKSGNMNLLHAFSKNLYERVLTFKGNIKVSLDIDPLNFS